MVDFRIRVVVDPSGATVGNQRVRREFQRTENAADSLRRTIGRAFALIGIGAAIRQLGAFSDAFVELQNRVRIATGGLGEVNSTLDRLTAIAVRTRAPVSEVAQLFQRASLAANELGASQEQLFDFTEAIGQALAIQGGAANTARGALIQLSQAVGSGTVRAEEFNSILEGAFPIALAAARGLDEAGGSVARLRTLVIEGQVSSTEFFNAILSQAGELEAQFATTTPTLAQAFGVLNTGLVRASENLQTITAPLARFIRDVGLAVGVLAGLDPEEIAPPSQVERIRELAAAIENVARVAGALAVALGITGLVGALQLATRAVITFTVAIATNPLGALTTGLTLAISALITFGDRLQLTQGSAATVFDFLVVGFQEVVSIISVGINTATDVLFGFENALGTFDFLEFVQGIARGLDSIIALFQGATAVISEVWRRFAETSFGRVFIDAINFVLRATTAFVNSLIGVINRIPGVDLQLLASTPQIEVAASSGRTLGEVFVENYQAGIEDGFATGFVERIAEGAAARARERIAASARDTGSLDDIIVGARNREPVIDVGAQRDAREALAGVDVELGGRFGIEGELEQIQLLEEERLRIVQEAVDQRVITEQEGADRRFAIERRTQELIENLEIERARRTLALGADTFGSLSNIARQFAGEQSGIFRALFAVEKGFALAEAIINTQVAITQALREPFPLNVAQTAAVAAQGAAAVATIVGQTFSGAGSFQNGVVGIQGPGSSRSDSIPAFLSRGESVITAAGTRNNAELLARINRGENVQQGNITEIGSITFNLPGVTDAEGFRRSMPQVQATLQRELNSNRNN